MPYRGYFFFVLFCGISVFAQKSPYVDVNALPDAPSVVRSAMSSVDDAESMAPEHVPALLAVARLRLLVSVTFGAMEIGTDELAGL